MKSKTDNELVQLVRLDNDDALNELVIRYQPMINRVKYHYFLRDYDHNDWQQEAMIICYETTKLFKIEKAVKFGGFFKLRLHNHAKSLLRRESAQKRKSQTEAFSYEKSSELGIVPPQVYFEMTLQTLRFVDYSKLEEQLKLLSIIELKALQIILGEKMLENLTEAEQKRVRAAKDRCRKKLLQFLTENESY
ncbi:sigma factor [Holzapfeliella sp. He02]|uniref:Sigma factor n=1 Tax=Holzapfeliella saturejae TaxID=3082953 RepID=A0ABU8SHG8_9LACO